MLDSIRGFLSGLRSADQDKQEAGYSLDDPQICAAALMYHVIQADGVLREVEQERLAAVLQEEYSLDSAELAKLIETAKIADGEAVDLYRFTSVLMRNLDEAERIKFIELLWEMVYADGVRHELEDNVVWRVSELLGVSGRDRVLMRQQVQARSGITDKGESEN